MGYSFVRIILDSNILDKATHNEKITRKCVLGLRQRRAGSVQLVAAPAANFATVRTGGRAS